ncbi:MAG: type ISP restriction/modification enzyme [Anaerolineae bacterium]|nr:type ISP restriction/modification enzyme [Anaerolineae bacterium]
MTYSGGVKTNRDTYAYNFAEETLKGVMQSQIQAYNAEVDRYLRSDKPKNVDDFVSYDVVNWSRDLKLDLRRGRYAEYSETKIRQSVYRPFTKRYLFFDRIMNEEVYVFPSIFPTPETEAENRVIIIGGYGRKDFAVNISDLIPDLNFYADPAQNFPFYVYDEAPDMPQTEATDDATTDDVQSNPTPSPSPRHLGGEQSKSPPDALGGDLEGGRYTRRENITDWALGQFRAQYGDERITKWDIFYYVYALLHHPTYRERYADNLKRELPRIPFVPVISNPTPSPSPTHLGGEQSKSPLDALGGDLEGGSGFWAFSRVGKKLADIHLNYESQPRYAGLEWVTKEGVAINYRVEKMRPQKKRKVRLQSLTTPAPSPEISNPTPSPSPKRQGGDQSALKSLSDASERDLGRGSAEITVFDTLKYNDTLSITGIPEKAFAYRLGNRSALEWVIDQYRVKTDKRSGITSDPNGYSDDDQYIVKLVERVIQVSVDTVELVSELAQWDFRVDKGH